MEGRFGQLISILILITICWLALNHYHINPFKQRVTFLSVWVDITFNLLNCAMLRQILGPTFPPNRNWSEPIIFPNDHVMLEVYRHHLHVTDWIKVSLILNRYYQTCWVFTNWKPSVWKQQRWNIVQKPAKANETELTIMLACSSSLH